VAHRFHSLGAGPQEITCTVPALPFATGTFDATVTLLDEHQTRTHAVRTRGARIAVVGDGDEAGALVALRAEWSEPSNATR
jgi:hypothetical protein